MPYGHNRLKACTVFARRAGARLGSSVTTSVGKRYRDVAWGRSRNRKIGKKLFQVFRDTGLAPVSAVLFRNTCMILQHQNATGELEPEDRDSVPTRLCKDENLPLRGCYGPGFSVPFRL